MSETTIRAATPADYPSFVELYRELKVDDDVATPERFNVEMMPTTLLAERAGEVAGYAFYRPMTTVVHLSHVVAAPHARRAGVGRALMTEVARRARDVGCEMLSLNVAVHNAAAIALYESFGLTLVHRNRCMKLDWAVIDTLSAEATPYIDQVRPIAREEDEALEQELALPAGILGEQRARPGRELFTIPRKTTTLSNGEASALAVFDPAFPGTYPLRAPTLAHALSLLRALRPHARPQDAFVLLPIENHDALADALVATGAQERFSTLFMRGAIR